MERWEHYQEDGADVGVRGFGETEADAFEQAALALTAALADPDSVSPRERVVIQCAAADDEQLLAAWLNAVLRKMRSTGMLFSRFDVSLDGLRLTAHAWGEPANRERHRPACASSGRAARPCASRATATAGWRKPSWKSDSRSSR